jgi:hypothetical protein
MGERWTDEAVRRESERWIHVPSDGTRLEDERRLLVHLPRRWGQSRVWRSAAPDGALADELIEETITAVRAAGGGALRGPARFVDQLEQGCATYPRRRDGIPGHLYRAKDRVGGVTDHHPRHLVQDAIACGSRNLSRRVPQASLLENRISSGSSGMSKEPQSL